MNAREQLNPQKLEQFCKVVVNDAGFSNKQKFTELHNICAGKMELQEMLLDLLSAPEALELGTEIYQQFCSRDAVKRFFRKVRILYASQPSMHTRILKEFQTILSNPDVKAEEVSQLGQKYFKTNQHLLDEFMSFVSDVPYPEGLLPEAEMIDLSDEEDEDKGTFDEKINLLEDGTEDDLGGEQCPCACHPTAAGSQHCIHCSLKFVNGRVYSRDGKTLRPVKVQFPPNAGSSTKGKKKRRKCK